MSRAKQPAIKAEQTVWNLKPLFTSDDDPRVEEKRKIVEQKSYAFINTWKERTDYLENPVVLRQALDHYESWKRQYGTDGRRRLLFLASHAAGPERPKTQG